MRRTLPLLVVAAVALGVTGCGDDDDDTPETTATGEDTTPDTEDQTADTEDSGDDSDGEGTLPGGVTLPDGVTIPDISIPDFSIPDISLPDISIPEVSLPDQETIEQIIESIFPGLDAEQIECVAEQFAEEFDPSDAARAGRGVRHRPVRSATWLTGDGALRRRLARRRRRAGPAGPDRARAAARLLRR